MRKACGDASEKTSEKDMSKSLEKSVFRIKYFGKGVGKDFGKGNGKCFGRECFKIGYFGNVSEKVLEANRDYPENYLENTGTICRS